MTESSEPAHSSCCSNNTRKQSLDVLREFLEFPLSGTDEIFDRFQALPGARLLGDGRKRVLYIEGSRHPSNGRCLLVAHADTVWDHYRDNDFPVPTTAVELYEEDENIYAMDTRYGLGADDRAGLAILWLLRDLGHSLMITDLEEEGCVGSRYLREHEPAFLRSLNRDHAFAVQFDRRGSSDFKCYDVATPAFRRYIAKETGYREPDRNAYTDIRILCDPDESRFRMCGVNLSVGYYEEHTDEEHLVTKDWLRTLSVARRWLGSPSIPSFHR